MLANVKTSDKRIKFIVAVWLVVMAVSISLICYDMQTNPQYGIDRLKAGFNRKGYDIEDIEFIRTEKLFVFRATEPVIYAGDGKKYEYWISVDETINPPFYKYGVRPYTSDKKPPDWVQKN